MNWFTTNSLKSSFLQHKRKTTQALTSSQMCAWTWDSNVDRWALLCVVEKEKKGRNYCSAAMSSCSKYRSVSSAGPYWDNFAPTVIHLFRHLVAFFQQDNFFAENILSILQLLFGLGYFLNGHIRKNIYLLLTF